MADLALDRFQPLISEAFEAFQEDFRYSESFAKQAGVLISRKEAKQRKPTEAGPEQFSAV